MVVYQDSLSGIGPGELSGFFVGWPNPPGPETHLRLLKKSDHIILARDGKNGPVVGCIAALSDGVLFEYISHLEVLPGFQRRGIGKELVRRMLEKLGDMYAVDLSCDPDVQPFYATCGLQPAAGMCLRRYHRQSGAAAASENEPE